MNYVYCFDKSVITIPILLVKNNFAWPKINVPGDAILLKLDVKDKKLKKISRPYLKIKSENYISKQYIERHNKGIRYFNVSEIAHNSRPGQVVTLSSNRLMWNKTAELLIFQNNICKDAKVLVIAPHPDDAELAAFGFYSTHDTHIITVTAGEGGRIDYCQMYSNDVIKQWLFKAKVRILDSITVPIRGGVDPQKIINLGYFNKTLSYMYRNPENSLISQTTGISNVNEFRNLNLSTLTPHCSGKATWNNLITDLITLINHIKPNIIVLPHPILDKHPDHCFSALATFEALKKCNINDGKFLFYVTWIDSTFSAKYPHGPRHTPITVPPNFQDSTTQYSVFSYPLTWQQQIEKLFALNAMHDIAPVPGALYNVKTLLKQKLEESKYALLWLDSYRKAVRSNELFLVASYEQTDELIKLTEKMIS